MDTKQQALKLHEDNRGKIEIKLKASITNKEELSLAYTPGVAEPCKIIAEDKEAVYRYTNRGNFVAVITDGTAVLGLGDLGPVGGYPVMEGKAALFKAFANVDAIPICLNTTDTEEIIKTIINISPTFGGINLEDISSPRCFEIERRLVEELDIPVFHDDQHGTAVIVFAALINALKLSDKALDKIKIVINGVGAAGSAVAKLLLAAGATNLVLVGPEGMHYPGDVKNNFVQEELVKITNPEGARGDLATAMQGADVFIGVSKGNLLNAEMIATMNEKSIIFAMANPVPEVFPDEAKRGGAFIIGTGRSDFPNQINNVLVFPGIFRGALDAKATRITEDMKIAAAYAVAQIAEKELSPDYIIPDVFNPLVAAEVAKAVAAEAKKSGYVRQ